MKTIVILLSLLFITSSDVTHQDSILKINENGEIVGLPKQFHPAKFDQEKKVLRIKDKVVAFPSCLKQYFEEFENPALKLSASWYHSKSILPYYINFAISQKDLYYGYTILIDLETLELIYVQKSHVDGNTSFSKTLMVKECSMAHKQKIKTLK